MPNHFLFRSQYTESSFAPFASRQQVNCTDAALACICPVIGIQHLLHERDAAYYQSADGQAHATEHDCALWACCFVPVVLPFCKFFSAILLSFACY
jgi:hypothetical protein